MTADQPSPTSHSTITCTVCDKPVELLAVQQWQHADGKQYRHRIAVSADLPATLRTVADVVMVCQALGLPEVTSGQALAAWADNEKSTYVDIPITRTWQTSSFRVKAVRDHRLDVSIESFAGGDWIGRGRSLDTSLLLAAIRAVRDNA